ncbi:MAG: sigma-70 family RNA polymerase sigma factor [Planctomycetota bacterium]
MQDDAAAVALARDGKEDGFRVLVERHSRHVFRLACRMTGRPEDAEEVVQETFMRAFRQLGRFEARANFSTWLYRIAYNSAIDFLRARPHRETTEGRETLEAMSDVVKTPDAHDLAYAGEISKRVDAALEALSPKERAAFLMRHYHGHSIEEIGVALGMKTNATKHSIFRAVRKMRVALEPLAGERAGTAGTAEG